MNVNDREDVMKHWDSWRRYIAEGGEGSWPRDAFESVLEHFFSRIEELEAKEEAAVTELFFCEASLKTLEKDERTARNWRDKLQDRIEELEKNYNLCKHSFELLIKSEEAEMKERIRCEDYKADIENACKMAMDEKCTLDQKHCTCVPLLRMKVKELEVENEKLRGIALNLTTHFPGCICSPEYKNRGLIDPVCCTCDMRDELVDLNQALEEKE